MSKNHVGPLKKLPIEQGHFEANGKKYFIETSFSIERFAMHQKLQIEAGYGCTFQEMLENWKKVYKYANNMKFADIVILAYNMQKGVTKITEREPLMLRMCGLFINEEHEDRRTINDDMITKKIQDWQEEGYEVEGFFTLALNTIAGFIESYQKLTRGISEMENSTRPQK